MCLINMFDRDAAEDLIRRLDNLTPITRPQWGTMTALTVLPHMADVLREGLGEKDVPFKPSVYSFPVLRYVLSQWMPWPKGAPAPQELLQGTGGANPTDFENDKKTLIGLIRKFSKARNKTAPINSTFGPMSSKEWARYAWRDVDHHLRQFSL